MIMFYIHYFVLPEKTVKVLREGGCSIEAGTANSAVRSLAEGLRAELKVPRGRVRITSIDVMERLAPIRTDRAGIGWSGAWIPRSSAPTSPGHRWLVSP